tara:strand:- start:1266 stop:1412 length:147 start_codon:yes stop_codon:yes gene_type:complete
MGMFAVAIIPFFPNTLGQVMQIWSKVFVLRVQQIRAEEEVTQGDSHGG